MKSRAVLSYARAYANCANADLIQIVPRIIGFETIRWAIGYAAFVTDSTKMVPLPPIFEVQRAAERGTFDHGWLQTSHSFSFAEYYDPRYINWGALRVFNDDRVAAGTGFPTHEHRDMEIVAYVLSGELEHRDSLGSHGIVHSGGVRYMSAGRGVRHSEYNSSKTEGLHFLQMWVLPGTLDDKPTYGQVEFELADRRDKLLVVASGRPASAAPVKLTQDAELLVVRLEGSEVRHTFAPDCLGFIFVAEGSVRVAVQDDRINERGRADLVSGDGVRLGRIKQITLSGEGEVVVWDLPRILDEAND
jgi:redox-sensitive bicupin YhaK (pirin superfamily)